MFTNPSHAAGLPEVQALKKKIQMRSAALLFPWAIVLLVALGRTGLYTFKFSSVFGTALLILALGGIVYLVQDQATFLPFLGETVLPTSALVLKTPTDASFSINVTVPSNATHVMYWASESGSGIGSTPFEAYGTFGNAGVVKAQNDGSATLLVRCPQQYRVGGRALPRHVHYRAIFKSGIAGPVRTAPVTCL